MLSPSQSGSQESVSKRHKVSVPSVPMKAPVASPLVVPAVDGHGQQKNKLGITDELTIT